MEPVNKKWSSSCLELISVRLDHLDAKYTSVLQRYEQNHKNIEAKVGQIQAAVLSLEASMADNDRLSHVYNNLNGQFDAKIAEFRVDAQNWLDGMIVTLDMYARQQLDHISFDANLMQEKRGLIKLDEMVERLKTLHSNIINDMKDVVENRLSCERKLIETITEGKFYSQHGIYHQKRKGSSRLGAIMKTLNKEEIRVEMAKLLSNFKNEIISDITEMSHSREEFEDFVLETLEGQMSDFISNKTTAAKT
ncbi:hypothetical protein BBBOND_0401050 [Babesia bigemina]|uniref:Uncharacterized protein n=1 Tax=Babesia bigemina TaxID=5866 RepID=A0A061DAN7_BABBI|nr:hypothetical protein BBBOND_0401050 [Babesia bigemina]CDR97613.1 hypothetical protein BBBOND_0401050 [Babesia bigemina]|eukprot:XP_012769799.1 hypothetical protein BBBOND_0401050 [Babesia bigemina]